MSILTIILLIWTIPATIHDRQPSSPQLLQIADPVTFDSWVKFDEWGDIRFSDEKARLDNIAIYAHNHPHTIIYLIVYAGPRACIGEAKARGLRAKKHLVSGGIPPDRVVSIDGGHQRGVTTAVWIWPPDARPPSPNPELNLKPGEVIIERNCRIKYRRRSS